MLSSPGTPLEKLLALNELKQVDGFVQWGNQNNAHPRNWPRSKKAFNASVIIFLQFFTTSIGIAGTPAAEHARDEYHIDRTLSIFVFTSVYLIAQVLGGMMFPPFSETFGRKKLYIASTFIYCIFCVLIATVPSLAATIVGRFVTGFVSPIPALVTAGSIEDMFDTRARIWVMWAWGTASNLGLVSGPIIGSYVAFWYGWRWIFHFGAIVLLIFFCVTLFLDETRPSLLLKQQALALERDSGHTLNILNPDHVPHVRAFVQLSLTRPLRLLFTEPIVALISVMGALSFGLIFFLTEALPVVYASFGFTAEQASLAFIPIGLGLFLSASVRFYDHRLVKKRQQQGRNLVPEDKLVGFAIAAPLLAISLWAFTCAVPPLASHVPWVFSMLVLVPAGFAANEIACTLAGYLADSYTTYAASAFAAYLLLRSSSCAVLPLFAHQMYVRLGPNVASSIIAGFATVCCLCPFVLLRYGRKIREASVFARYSLEVYRKHAVDEPEHDEIGKTPANSV
ncbi:MAG: hypothetical protein M1812_005915 [Candelaria pacifica]|nr:MAG: hypothetical protein M1812_005915 [Candelaria pacifica]